MPHLHRAAPLLLLLLFTPCIFIKGAGAGLFTREEDQAIDDVAIALDATSFKATLSASPAPWAIIEFYAHWCSHCRNFKPDYERVARLFNGPDAVYPRNVFMAKVDCASKKNGPLCDRFNIQHLPTLVWALPSDLEQVSAGNVSFEVIGNGHTAELLLRFINNRTGQNYILENQTTVAGQRSHKSGADFRQRSPLSNHDIEEATAEAMEIIINNKLLNHQKSRSSFIQFLQLLVVHHPSRNCRRGTGEMLRSLQDLWPSLPKQLNDEFKGGDADPPMQEPNYEGLGRFRICGDHPPKREWIFCKGRGNNTDGYSCGLWLLLHAVTVRVEDRMAYSGFQTICNFVAYFVRCHECKRHFVEFCSSAKTTISSRRQLVLWLWAAHNEVNERVKKEESSSLGLHDPMFSEGPWPPPSLCPSCWNGTATNSSFVVSGVYNFVLSFYGRNLSSSNSGVPALPQRAQQAVLLDAGAQAASGVGFIPTGAAIAMAFTSCGFGIFAYFWRSRRNRRKYVD